MSVNLNANFFSNSRGVTLGDGGGVVWSINKNTNTISATVGGSAPISGWPLASGFGVPTGASVVANFSGTAATTAQMQATIAELIAVLTLAGIIAA